RLPRSAFHRRRRASRAASLRRFRTASASPYRTSRSGVLPERVRPRSAEGKARGHLMTSPLDSAAERAMRAAETYDGRAVTAWETAPPRIRGRWRAVAQAVLDPSAPAGALTRSRRIVELVDDEGD